MPKCPQNIRNLVSVRNFGLKIPTEEKNYPNCKNKNLKKKNLGDLANLFNLCNKILIFGSHMNPTNLYLMILIEIYISVTLTNICRPVSYIQNIMSYFAKMKMRSPKIT